MDKKILVLLLLIFIVGCSQVIERSSPQYFEDTGNKISNYETCNKLAKESCDSQYSCRGYKINKLECEDGKCYCD